MVTQVGCLRCGSEHVVMYEERFRQGTDRPLSYGLIVFLYLVGVPALVLGTVLLTLSAMWIYGLLCAVPGALILLLAYTLYGEWKTADVVVYHVCKACGYYRREDDPLPAIMPDWGAGAHVPPHGVNGMRNTPSSLSSGLSSDHALRIT